MGLKSLCRHLHFLFMVNELFDFVNSYMGFTLRYVSIANPLCVQFLSWPFHGFHCWGEFLLGNQRVSFLKNIITLNIFNEEYNLYIFKVIIDWWRSDNFVVFSLFIVVLYNFCSLLPFLSIFVVYRISVFFFLYFNLSS